MNHNKQYRRICIQRSGYALIQADTDEEAIAAAKQLSEHDFDWEPVNANFIEDTMEIVETIGPAGDTI